MTPTFEHATEAAKQATWGLHLWWERYDRFESSIEFDQSVLTPSERQSCQHMSDARYRRRRLIRRVWRRHILGNFLGVPASAVVLRFNRWERPILNDVTNSLVDFTTTSTGHWMGMAVATGDLLVGLDAEDEQSSTDIDCGAWVRQEAGAKAIGISMGRFDELMQAGNREVRKGLHTLPSPSPRGIIAAIALWHRTLRMPMNVLRIEWEPQENKGRHWIAQVRVE